MLRTSVTFHYRTHCVEYGAVRKVEKRPVPFVQVDGVDIELTPQLRYGWEIQAFGVAERAHMEKNSPSP